MRVRTCLRSLRRSSSSCRYFWDWAAEELEASSCSINAAFSRRNSATSSTARVMRSSRLLRESISSGSGTASGSCVGGLGLFHQRGETSGVVGGHVGQHLAVQVDTGSLQTADETAVRNL